MIGDIRDNNTKRGDTIHGLNMINYVKKQGYKSKANALCPLIINYAKEWEACSAGDLIRKADMCLDHEQKWSVKGVKINVETASDALRRLFSYSDTHSFKQLQTIFDSHPTDYRSMDERMIDLMGKEDWFKWKKHLSELNSQLLPAQEEKDPLALPELKSKKL